MLGVSEVSIVSMIYGIYDDEDFRKRYRLTKGTFNELRLTYQLIYFW